MIVLLTAVGITAGGMLSALLAVNWMAPQIGIWPAAGGRWQSVVFWLLFRVANVSALAIGIFTGPLFGDADVVTILAAVLAAAIAVLYLWSCIYLGRDNLYCGRAGLATSGVYRWTRNPQYAAAMPAYAALAVSALSLEMIAMTSLLVAIYHLMAINEEPWLEATYGSAYVDYRGRVPRYYNVKRLNALLRLEVRRLQRQLSYH